MTVGSRLGLDAGDEDPEAVLDPTADHQPEVVARPQVERHLETKMKKFFIR